MTGDARGMRALGRDELTEAIRLIDKVERGMGDLAHKLAVPLIHDLGDLRAIVGEAFPGGDPHTCAGCDELVGLGEIEATGDAGDFCFRCVERYGRDALPGPLPMDEGGE